MTPNFGDQDPPRTPRPPHPPILGSKTPQNPLRPQYWGSEPPWDPHIPPQTSNFGDQDHTRTSSDPLRPPVLGTRTPQDPLIPQFWGPEPPPNPLPYIPTLGTRTSLGPPYPPWDPNIGDQNPPKTPIPLPRTPISPPWDPQFWGPPPHLTRVEKELLGLGIGGELSCIHHHRPRHCGTTALGGGGAQIWGSGVRGGGGG